MKPQFEAGREEVGRGGLVTDPAVHAAVVARVTGGRGGRADAAGHDPSPITGATATGSSSCT